MVIGWLVGVAGDDSAGEGGRERVHGAFQRIAQRARPRPVGSSERVTKYRHLSAACSLGKCPRARVARRYRALSDSMAFVEQITFLISAS